MWPFSAPKCPVSEKDRQWIERRMKFLSDQFGKPRWRTSRAIEPTDEFFPEVCDGSEPSVRKFLDRICGFMDVRPDLIELQICAEVATPTELLLADSYPDDKKEIITIEKSRVRDPLVLAATIARELALARLAREKRVTAADADLQPLLDLTTVFFGMGVFSANSRFRYGQVCNGHAYRWQASRLGVLDEPMFGYALGLWAIGRQETSPGWAQHLATNPRSFMKQSIRFMQASPPSLELQALGIAP